MRHPRAGWALVFLCGALAVLSAVAVVVNADQTARFLGQTNGIGAEWLLGARIYGWFRPLAIDLSLVSTLIPLAVFSIPAYAVLQFHRTGRLPGWSAPERTPFPPNVFKISIYLGLLGTLLGLAISLYQLRANATQAPTHEQSLTYLHGLLAGFDTAIWSTIVSLVAIAVAAFIIGAFRLTVTDQSPPPEELADTLVRTQRAFDLLANAVQQAAETASRCSEALASIAKHVGADLIPALVARLAELVAHSVAIDKTVATIAEDISDLRADLAQYETQAATRHQEMLAEITELVRLQRLAVVGLPSIVARATSSYLAEVQPSNGDHANGVAHNHRSEALR